jgi:hypothetical protein
MRFLSHSVSVAGKWKVVVSTATIASATITETNI